MSTDGTTLDASSGTKGTTLEACLVTEGPALEACLVTKGIKVDESLVAKQSTYDSVTSSKQLDECSISGNENRSFDQESSSSEIDADADIRLSYDSDIVFKVHHDMFENVFAYGIQNHKQPESIPDTYVVNENNSNIISDIPHMDPDRGKEEHDDVDYEQQRALLASLINTLKCDVEKCNRVNRQTDQTLRMLLLKEDNVQTGKQGIGFENQNDVENPSLLNKAKELVPSLYNIDEMEKELLSDHKIISEEELKCEAENRLKVKQRKSLLSYHGFLYGETQFEEPPKQNPPRENVFINSSFKDNVKRIARNQVSEEFEPLIKDVNLQLNCFEKGLVKEMKDDLNHVYENDIFKQNSSLENKNRCLKKTITELSKQAADVKEEMTKRCAQYEKDFAKLEAHCISLEFKSKNKYLTSVQNGQVLSNKSDEAKIKFDIEDLKTINIELEYSVASLLKENEHLKIIDQNLFDSIKRSRVQTKSSNISQNEAENLKSQLFEFADKKYDKVFQKIESMNKKKFDSRISNDFIQKYLYDSDPSNVESESREKKILFENETSSFNTKIKELEIF
ncbi:hypothetical protein Tco_1531766 [Tanacetum coccineum]